MPFSRLGRSRARSTSRCSSPPSAVRKAASDRSAWRGSADSTRARAPKKAADRAMAPRLCGLPMPSSTGSSARLRQVGGQRVAGQRLGEAGDGDGADAAMVLGAGDPGQLLRPDFAVGAAGAGEVLAERPGEAPPFLGVEQPEDLLRAAEEQGAHRRRAADAVRIGRPGQEGRVRHGSLRAWDAYRHVEPCWHPRGSARGGGPG